MSLADEVAQGLRDLIFSGQLVPGDRVGEMEMAARFQTSQAPVREAFAVLRQEGLLISLPRRGTFVSGFSLEEARSVYEIRLLLEPYVIDCALERLTDADVASFAADLAAMKAAAPVPDYADLTVHDMRFHGRFYALSGSEIAQAIWSLIEVKVRTFISVAGKEYFSGVEMPEVAALHERLLELIERRDGESLKEEVRRQLLLIWDRIQEAEALDARRRAVAETSES
jgi:DNA-binding GntR family transcriptional regulator